MRGTSWMAVVLAATSLPGGGCGGRDDSEPGGPDAGSDADTGQDAGPTRTVTIRHGWNRHTDSGATFDPIDASSHEVEALVPTPDSQWVTIAGEGHPDGTASIAGVPSGTVTIRFDSFYVVTDADSIDLLFDDLGREDLAYVGDPTEVTFQVDEMSAWAPNDMLQAFSAGAATYVWELESLAGDTAPDAGDTDLSATIDWSAASGGEIDTSLGDVLTLFKLSTRFDGALQFRPLTDAFVPDPMSVQNAEASVVSGSFSPVGQHDLALDWRRSELEALREAVHPDAGPGDHVVAVCALPGAHAAGYYAESSVGCPDLVLVDADGAETTDVSYQLTYGNPFEGWDAFVRADVAFPISFTAAGADQPETIWSRIGSYLALPPGTESIAVRPALSPPRSPTIDGHDAWQTQDGVGTTPTLRWEPPATGEPTRYWVTVARVVADGPNTDFEYPAGLYTREPFVQLPPGILAEGETYFFQIGAASTDAELTSPWTRTMPYHSAAVVTALMHP